MAVGDGEMNPGILDALRTIGLVGPQNVGPTYSEILQILKDYGMQGINREGPDPLLQPVGHEGNAAMHWTQGLNSMLRAGLGRSALDTYMRGLTATKRHQPVPTPTNVPPAASPPAATPPTVTPPANPWAPTVSVAPSSFNGAPDGRGAGEITNALDEPIGDNLLHLAQDTDRQPRKGPFNPRTDNLIDWWRGETRSGVEAPPTTSPAVPPAAPPTTPHPFDMSNRQSFIDSGRSPENITDVPKNQNRLPPGETPDITNWPDPFPGPGQELLNREPPAAQPPAAQPPAAQPPGERRTIGGLPVYTPQDFDAVADIPPPIPYRFGQNPEQLDAFLSTLTPEQRKAQEDHLTYQYTPQYVDTLGGRTWTIPATGQRGFIPTPRFDRLRVGNAELTTVTLIDRNGRTRTYILEPAAQTPSAQPITGQPPPPSQPLPSGEQPPTAQPPANITPPSPTTQIQPPPSNVPPPSPITERPTVLDHPLFERQREIERQQAADITAGNKLVDTAVAPITEAAGHGRTANQTLQITSLIESLLNQPNSDRIITGQLAPPLLRFMQSANGLITAGGGSPIFDTNRVSMMEVFEKLNAYLASSASRELTNRPTQFDFQRFMQANPGITNSLEGNRLLVGILRRFAERDRAVAEYAGRFSEDRAGATRPTRGFIDGMHRIYDQHMSSFGELLLNQYARSGGRIRIPIGFRYNNREFMGGDPSKRENWRDVTSTPTIGR